MDTHLEVVHFDLGIIAPLPIVDAKSPGMPRASHNPPFQISTGQRSSHVRAKVIDREVRPAIVEDRHHPAIDGKRCPSSLRNLANLGDGDKVGHVRS